MRTLAPLLLTLALVPTAAAQGEDGCTHADPCPWVVDVDPSGFASYLESEVTFSVGDWYEIMVFNDDADRSHTITLSGHDVSITVPADGMSEDTGAFQLNQAGTFTLKDMPTGDTITVHVTEDDAVAGQDDDAGSSGSDGNGAPALPLAVLVGALAAVAAALRRR